VGWPEEKVLAVCPRFRALPQGVNLLVQVHDSLVVECPKSMLDDVVENLRYVMEQPWRELAGFSIPVEVQFGPSWGELEVYNGLD
jgi:DNA polymerase I-like protein with 3'-5' exonuclease and polymerase domains